MFPFIFTAAHFHLACWLSYFTLVCLTDGRSLARCTVTWLPNFLVWVDYHISFAPRLELRYDVQTKIKVDFMQQTTERNSIESNIVGSRSEFDCVTLPSPLRLVYSLFQDRRAGVRKWKPRVFLDPQAQGNVCGQATSRPFFSWYDSTESCHEGLFNRFCCVTCSKPFGNPCNEKSEQAVCFRLCEKGGQKCNEKEKSLFMLVTSHVQSFNATQQKKQLKQLNSVVLQLE